MTTSNQPLSWPVRIFLMNLLVFLSLPLDYRGLIKTEIVTIFFSDISPKPCTMPTTKEALGKHLLKEASSLSNPYPSYTVSVKTVWCHHSPRHHIILLPRSQSPHSRICQSTNFTFYIFLASTSPLSIPTATVLTLITSCLNYASHLNPLQSIVALLPI